MAKVETQIVMHQELRDEVLAGKRTTAWRPGHREYELGPVSIRFIGKTETFKLPRYTDDPPVDVILTKVEHTVATGKYEVYMDFMRDLGQPSEDRNDITLLEWKLM